MKKCFFLALSLFIATLVSAQMSGTYTINSNSSSNPDYTSFSAAASALSAGVSGQVIFEVAPGTYEEYVTINEINDASATNRVIFRGMGADNQQVVITSNAGYTDNATVKLNGTDYVTFENMTVTTTSTAKAQLLRFNGQCDYTRFENVRFVGLEVTSNSSDNDKNLVHMYNGDGIVDHDTQFVGCQFINGSIALYLQGKNMSLFNDGLLVENCYFENQSFKSIYVTFYNNNLVLRGNTIVNANDYKNDYNAIDIFQCYNGATIEKNVMNVTRTTAYSTVFRVRPIVGTETNHVIIRNNIVNLQANSSSYAFAIDYNDCAYIDFAHNTLKCAGTGENINIFVQKNGTNFNFYNNLLVNTTNGYVFRFNNEVSSRMSDYNRIQYSGSHLGRFTTTDCATLADWTSATGFDSHSTMCTPNFVGNNDLHITNATGLTVANPLSYVPTDIDGQSRSTTAPCAGADEFASGTNLPPVVQNPVSNITFNTYPASQTVDLNNSFNDPDDPNENIVITIASNSNADLVSATLSNKILTLTRLVSTGGTATITLNAESAGQSVQTSFSVECVAEDLPPVVANQIEPINFTEYPQSFTFDITEAFDDPDNNNLFIEIEVYSCPEEITATIDDEEEYLTVSRNTASAFIDKTLVLRATSNGKHVDMNISVSGEEVVINVGTATFDDVTLNASGIWTGANENNLMVSGGWFFTNTYWPAYSAWGGFTASNHTDMTQTGLNAQYTAATGAGFDGSDQYGVAYVMGYGVPTDVYAADGQEHTVTGFYVTNNLWAYNHILEGETGVTPFGGTSGNDPDWFKLTATGKNAAGQTVGTAEFYLADYRFENNDEDYILNTWEWFDLSTLGAVQTISFELSSTKNNTYGMVTPAYFCLENFNGEAPLPPTPDEPPYVIHPVGTITIETYPETVIRELTNVVTDPDDPDEDIVYSFISNTNETDLQAYLTNDAHGRYLVLTRRNDKAAEATVTIRATSDGQYVDFDVYVVMKPTFIGVDEVTYNMSVYPNPTEGEIHIIVDNIEQFEYNVFNIVGQNMMNGISDGREAHLDLSGLEKGVYFVTVFTENQKFVERIIVK